MLIGDCHILHHLIIGALQKRRVYGKDRMKSAMGQSGRESNCVRFCDSHIIKSFWITGSEFLQTGSVLHCCRDGTDFSIFFRSFCNPASENCREILRPIFTTAQFCVKLRNTMIGIRLLFRKTISFSFYGVNVHQNRTVRRFRTFKRITKAFQIVSVYRTNIFKSEILK